MLDAIGLTNTVLASKFTGLILFGKTTTLTHPLIKQGEFIRLPLLVPLRPICSPWYPYCCWAAVVLTMRLLLKTIALFAISTEPLFNKVKIRIIRIAKTAVAIHHQEVAVTHKDTIHHPEAGVFFWSWHHVRKRRVQHYLNPRILGANRNRSNHCKVTENSIGVRLYIGSTVASLSDSKTLRSRSTWRQAVGEIIRYYLLFRFQTD